MASGGPVWLVECPWDGKIRVNPEAVRILSRLPAPLRVVSIFGPRQSGKSYLLDVLAGSSTDGFTVSGERSPHDLRIDMWTLPDTEEPGHALVLLDTTGFEDDLGIENAAFTCPIFTLSLLLSSVFLYNTRGPVSTDALDRLVHLTMMANQVSLPAYGQAAASLLPRFVWCVRDYDLSETMGGVELVPEDYLDSVIVDAQGLSSPSGFVVKVFSRERMEIFGFGHPLGGAEIRDGVPLRELEPGFTRLANALKKRICRSEPKVLQDCQAMSGADLGRMLEQLVESLLSGTIIQLDGVIGGSGLAESTPYQDLPGDLVVTAREVLPMQTEVPREVVLPRHTEIPRAVQRPAVERETPLREAPARLHNATSANGTSGSPVCRHPLDMDGPVCLIENTSAGKLQVNKKALEILQSIGQPVVVVSIVGLYRTGKSYLMNRLAGKQTGFSLGSTIQSETKGIWIWCVPHPKRDGRTLVLLDTEGLGDVEKGDEKNDTWIFSLAVLLSSTFVYNSMGTINNQALMGLHYVTELTECIKVKSTAGTEAMPSEYGRFFPTFVWAVRDFSLKLEIDGKTVTADEYLENSLKLNRGHSKAISQGNDARDCIRNYFQERKCFVFDRPGSSEKLKRLDRLADSELEPQFVKQTSDFCSYVFSCSKEKTIQGGITVTGSMLANLAVSYVDAIRSGSIPCLENAVAALSQIQNPAAVEESFALYRQLLGERVELPTETLEELSSAHEGCLKEALQLFMKRSFKDDGQTYQEALMERVKKAYEDTCLENEAMSQNHCMALLYQLEEDMDPVESFMKPGGHQRFKDTMDGLVGFYKTIPDKGVKGEKALEDFLCEKRKLEKMILAADKQLSEQEKHLREQRAEAEREMQRAAAAREQQEALKRRMDDIERARQQNEWQLREKMERDQRELREESQRLLDGRLREQRALLEEGYKGRAEQMEREIRRLREERAQESRSRGGGGCVLS